MSADKRPGDAVLTLARPSVGSAWSVLRNHAAFRVETLAPASLALVLGLITLGKKSWWWDEAYNVSLARDGWLKYVLKAGYYEPSQALYLVLFKFWGMLTPESEWFTRLPSVVAASVAAALVGLLGTRLFGRPTGVVAGILMATNATVVAWSQQTRTYAFAALAAVVVTMLFLRAMESESRRPWVVYGIAAGLGAYAHFFVLFVLPAHAALVSRMSATQRRRLRESWAITAVVFAPAVPFVLVGGRGGAGWIPPTSWDGVRAAVSTVGGFNAVALIAAAAGVIAILSGRTRLATRWKGTLLLVWAVAPLAGALVVSVATPTLVGRYLIVAAPALALLGAAALTAIRPRWIAVGVGVLLLSISAREIVRWYDATPEDWRGATQYAVAEARSGVTVVLYPTFGIDAYQVYAPLPAQCKRLPGHHEPRCSFHAAGRKTLVLMWIGSTTKPDEWRQLPGVVDYRVVAERHFGDRIRTLSLERKSR